MRSRIPYLILCWVTFLWLPSGKYITKFFRNSFRSTHKPNTKSRITVLHCLLVNSFIWDDWLSPAGQTVWNVIRFVIFWTRVASQQRFYDSDGNSFSMQSSDNLSNDVNHSQIHANVHQFWLSKAISAREMNSIANKENIKTCPLKVTMTKIMLFEVLPVIKSWKFPYDESIYL
jgi:hypothetical protein